MEFPQALEAQDSDLCRERLVLAAKEQRKMLRAVHLCGLDLYRESSDFTSAVESYRREWLPKIASGCDEVLVASSLATVLATCHFNHGLPRGCDAFGPRSRRRTCLLLHVAHSNLPMS